MLINPMNTTDKPDNSYDYPVAMALNESVKSLFSVIRFYQIIGPLKEFDPAEINRLYILLVNELEILYDRSPKLAQIKPEPVWRKFDVIKNKIYSVQKYLEEHDTTDDHILRIEKLCILSEHEIPKLSSKQKKFIDDMKNLTKKYLEMLAVEIEKQPKDDYEMPTFYIPEFTFTYKQDGTVLINDVLKLKKVHAGSISEHLLEQCMKNPDQLFKPNLGRTSRNISTILSSIGITPIMRDLFFPIVSNDKGVLFRPKITFSEALDDRISTRKFEEELIEHGAVPHLVTPEIFQPTNTDNDAKQSRSD